MCEHAGCVSFKYAPDRTPGFNYSAYLCVLCCAVCFLFVSWPVPSAVACKMQHGMALAAQHLTKAPVPAGCPLLILGAPVHGSCAAEGRLHSIARGHATSNPHHVLIEAIHCETRSHLFEHSAFTRNRISRMYTMGSCPETRANNYAVPSLNIVNSCTDEITVASNDTCNNVISKGAHLLSCRSPSCAARPPALLIAMTAVAAAPDSGQLSTVMS